MPEKTMDEKQTQSQPAPASAPAGKGSVFLLLARIGVVLMGISWAGTVSYLLSQFSWMGSANVPVGRVQLSGAGLAAGVLLGAALVFGVMKKLGDQLDYTKPGLGRAVRMTAYLSIGSLTAYGAYAMYMAPGLQSPWWKVIVGPLSLMGKEASLRPQLFPALAVLLSVMLVVHLVLNRDRAAEFLIETEGEIKKVSWPARKEYVGSAMIVVLVVAIVSGFLHLVDLYLSKLMQALGVGF